MPGMTILRISVIIPLYYCSPSLYIPLQKCFNSLSALEEDFELIVVDDASPLDHGFPFTLINTENQGFTATVNKGLAHATGDILIVMNDDIELSKECFWRFKGLTGLQIASPADTASSPDDRFGACWAMTREVYDLLGPLNSKYRNFYSDLDYYNRAKAADVEIIKWHDLVLDHPESSTYKLLNKKTLLSEDKRRFEEASSV